MTTKNTDVKTGEVVEGQGATAVAVRSAHTAIAAQSDRPEYIGQTGEGTEHITKEEMNYPRLALAQKMSYELDPEHPKFMPDLKLGDFFNTASRKIYGPGPLEFVVLRGDRGRWVEFIPREQGGGIKDMDIANDDPRTKFRKGAANESLPPIATKFLDFIVLLLPSTPTVEELEPIGISFKSTGLKAARNLNTLIKMRMGAEIYAGKYLLESDNDQNAKGKFKIYKIRNSTLESDYSHVTGQGKVKPGWVNLELYDFAQFQHRALKDKPITIDIDTADGEDDTSFDGPGYDKAPTDM